MGKDLECQAKDFGMHPGSIGEPFNFLAVGVRGLELHFREIKPMEGWETGGEETIRGSQKRLR